jgi:hypothetical protein
MTRATALLLVLAACGLAACGDRDADAPVLVATDLAPGLPAALAADRGAMSLSVDDVAIRRGRDAKTVAHVFRDGLPGTVLVRFSNLPSGVTVVDDANGLLGEHGNFTFRAEATAPLVDDHLVTATATGPDGETATATFEMSVRE